MTRTMFRNILLVVVLGLMLIHDRFQVQGFKISSKLENELKKEDAPFEVISRNNIEVAEKDNIAGDSKEEIKEEVNPAFLFESDIKLVNYPEYLKNTAETELGDRNLKRSLRRSQEYLWIDRVVPYEFMSDISGSGRSNIRAALDFISQNSCLEFKVKDGNDRNWIRFENKGSCFSSVGRSFWMPGPQTISLSPNCLQSIGTIQHEMLHALGFWHEQSRSDRDNYIEILWENVIEGSIHNFEKASNQESTNVYQSLYDPDSVMHYNRMAFSKNGNPTIQLIGDKNKEIGQRRGMSNEDIVQLNRLYRCEDVGEIYTKWSEWSPCDRRDCTKKRQRFCSRYNAVKCPDANSFGVHTDTVKCSVSECNAPIDGHWGRWSKWSDCSANCGQGKQLRQRKCDDPTPSHGGRGCSGIASEEKACEVVPCGLNPDDCLFDSQGMCFWKDESPSSGYRWTRIKGRTPSGNTGPDNDHTTDKTTKDGYYMYVESSAPAKSGDKSSLVSKQFTVSASPTRCITFFYSMYGSAIGALRVFMRDVSSGVEQEIWSRVGDQGKGWSEGEVDFTSHTDYKIRFQAEYGTSFRGDIGLDDIHFRDSSCSVVMTTPQPQPLAPSTTESVINAPNLVSRPLIHIPGNLVPICSTRFTIEPKGCYLDKQENKVFSEILEDYRNGPVKIDWGNFPNTLADLVCNCAERAQAKGYKYFGLQYYGLCYGGNEAGYDKYGSANQCINDKYEEKCAAANTDSICIGVENMNYVYQLV